MRGQLVLGHILLSILLRIVSAQIAPDPGTNQTGPISQFKSRPDLYAPFLNVTILDEDAVTPGYIFLAPYQTAQPSIYLYDNYGNLVYSGFGQVGGGEFHNFHVANINSTDRLVYFAGIQGEGYARGYVNILDNTLTGISSVRVQNGRAALDEHEFQVVDDGRSALVTTFQPERADLSAYNVTSSQGWVMDGIFQKIAIGTNELLFEWSALDFVDFSETYVGPKESEVAGDGLSPATPWDYFHINSVDQTENGDFIVSARHTSTVYRISGQDGHIVWRLGGKLSNFDFALGVNFSFQHDARVRAENASTMILSLFDNAANGYYNQSSNYSSGMILKLDFTTTPHRVDLLSKFNAPDGFTSRSQGNLQLLPARNSSQRDDWASANAFLGWGSSAYISEHVPGNPGRIVQQAFFATLGSMNYRAYKHNVTIDPPDSPALYTYAERNTTDDASTVFYMSWNGATRVTEWRIYGRHSASTSAWQVLGTTQKRGFETIFTAPGYWAYGMVEALDESGTALRNSSSLSALGRKTFVPSPELANGVCSDSSCFEADGSTNGTVLTTTTTTQAPPAATTTTSNAAGAVKLLVTRRDSQDRLFDLVVQSILNDPGAAVLVMLLMTVMMTRL